MIEVVGWAFIAVGALLAVGIAGGALAKILS